MATLNSELPAVVSFIRPKHDDLHGYLSVVTANEKGDTSSIFCQNQSTTDIAQVAQALSLSILSDSKAAKTCPGGTTEIN